AGARPLSCGPSEESPEARKYSSDVPLVGDSGSARDIYLPVTGRPSESRPASAPIGFDARASCDTASISCLTREGASIGFNRRQQGPSPAITSAFPAFTARRRNGNSAANDIRQRQGSHPIHGQ